MLAFSKNQFEAMQSVWQADQLIRKIPEILMYLKECYDSLYDELGEEKNRENTHLRIKDAVLYGYTDIEDIKQQLDMQYQNRSIIFTHKSFQALYQARCLTAQDRNSAIAELLLIQRYSPKAHPYMKADALYQLGTNDILENYLAIEKQAKYHNDSPYNSNIHLIRHGRSYRFLKQYAPNSGEWKSTQSNWKTSMIAIESTNYHRSVQMLPSKTESVDFQFEEESLPQLKILIPDKLSQEDTSLLDKLLNTWILQLYPVKKMKQKFEKGDEHA